MSSFRPGTPQGVYGPINQGLYGQQRTRNLAPSANPWSQGLPSMAPQGMASMNALGTPPNMLRLGTGRPPISQGRGSALASMLGQMNGPASVAAPAGMQPMGPTRSIGQRPNPAYNAGLDESNRPRPSYTGPSLVNPLFNR